MCEKDVDLDYSAEGEFGAYDAGKRSTPHAVELSFGMLTAVDSLQAGERGHGGRAVLQPVAGREPRSWVASIMIERPASAEGVSITIGCEEKGDLTRRRETLHLVRR